MIYLDAASTAKYKNTDDIIINTMTEAMKKHWQNPSSLYATNVKEEINKCRENIAKFLDAKSNEIYFTSGASESNCWALTGFVLNNRKNDDLSCIITSCIEHKSIEDCLDGINSLNLGMTIGYIEVDENGFVNLNHLEETLKTYSEAYKCLVSIQLANNEIGVIQDIKEISKLVHKYNGVLHVDATQALPYIPINVKDLDIDMMSASGHKLSPVLKGVGFLYIKKGINIQPLVYGAQQNKNRGGTENTFGIIGLAKAIAYCDVSQEAIDKMCKKRNYFINLLECKFDCELNGDSYYRLPNNINVTFAQNITGEALLYTLDMSDVKIATSSACNSRSVEPSHVLKALGLTDEEAMRTIRITLSEDITYEDIDKVIEEINKAMKLIEI